MPSTEEIRDFLDEAVSIHAEDRPRPHVTLTFAQSVDGKIAGVGGKQLILSGNESMLMTHRLRSRHDAILVGIGTALNDNPQLNSGFGKVPLPVILDAHLRFNPESKLCLNYISGNGRQPTVFTSLSNSSDVEWVKRRDVLEKKGVKIITIPAASGILDLGSLLSSLNDMQIRSLMVEGGAGVISSFMGSGLVDSLIVTIAPSMVGEDGIGYGLGGEWSSFHYIRSLQLGRDTVMAWRLQQE